MRDFLLRCLLALSVAFTGWTLWRAFAVPAETPTETREAPPKRTPKRPLSEPAGHPADAPSDTPGGSMFPETLPEGLTDSHGRVRRAVFAEGMNPEALRQRLLAEGCVRLTWLPEGGYTASMTPEAAARLTQTGGLSLRPARVPVSRALREAAERLSPHLRLHVTLVCPDAMARRATEAAVRGVGRVELAADTALVARLTAGALGAVFRQAGADVSAADLRREGTLLGEATPPAPLSAALPRDFPYTGRGETVAVMDTGCSGGPGMLGTDGFHPDLEGALRAFLPQPWWALRDAFSPSDGTDALGHGTHVAGIVAGDGRASPGRRFRGVAPEAGLLIQNNAFGREGGLAVPPDLRSAFAEAYAQGARIHSDSWGSLRDGDAPYGLEAWAADTFVWEHPDALILFAAGNAGPAPGTLAGGAALGKNVLTVGALDSEGAGPAVFSSRGPTADGRPKPELLAPGEGIVATGPPPSHGYRAMSGTSMAAPFAAGVAANLRQALRAAYNLSAPSAALLKAALLLGCVPLEAEGCGFGALTPERLFLPEGAATAYAEFAYGPTGAEWSADVTLDAPGPLEAVLAWTDAPADIAAASAEVNVLGLRLLDAAGNPAAPPGERLGAAVRLRAETLPAGTYRLTAESLRAPLPGGMAAIALRMPDRGPRVLHVPTERMEPSTSVPLAFTVAGAEEEAVRLECSDDGETWEEAPQNRRLDAPRAGRVFWYRLVAGGRRWGPFAVALGPMAPLTVADDGTGFVASPASGTTMRCAGEEVCAVAHDAWRWEISRAGYPRIEGRAIPVAAWRLTDDASGRTLAQGQGAEAVFTMPESPATLRWSASPATP